MRRPLLVLLGLGAALVSDLGAQTWEPSFEGIRFWGADFGLTRGPWKLVAGGGWEELDLGRDADSGQILRPTASRADPLVSHPFPNAAATLGYTQNLASVQTWLMIGAWGHGDFGTGGASGYFSDLDGNTFGFIRSGATFDGRHEGPRGVVEGPALEAYVEWGPRWLAARGTDYGKLNLSSALLVPLWSLAAPDPLFAGTLALRANAGWIDGDQVPVPLLEGTEVRGYHQLFDTRFRSVFSSELRLSLPSLLGDHDLVPVVLGFTEAGWYWGYANTPVTENASGWLASVGVGAGLNVFGKVIPTLQLVLPLVGEHDLRLHFFFKHRF